MFSSRLRETAQTFKQFESITGHQIEGEHLIREEGGTTNLLSSDHLSYRTIRKSAPSYPMSLFTKIFIQKLMNPLFFFISIRFPKVEILNNLEFNLGFILAKADSTVVNLVPLKPRPYRR